tara:strand:- start:12 stop:554 length:543 start_codon:yes stop_codon:yes gene_type:complete
MLDKALLKKEIRQWSSEVLEVPDKSFNNLPACPFAKFSWNKDRVRVMQGEGGYWYDLLKIIQNFDDKYDVVVYCGTDYEKITADELELRIDILNEEAVQNDLWVMGSHPDTEIDHAVSQENFEPILEEDYYQIFVQRLEVLIKASDSIKKKGYYKKYKSDDFKQLIQRRKEKWLEQKNLK